MDEIDSLTGSNEQQRCPESTSIMFKPSRETDFGSPLYYQSLPVIKTKASGYRSWNWASIRLIRLCCFGIFFPFVCVVLPVYARYVLYSDSMMPLAASDMRLVDGHISTTWCQGQKLEMNVSFDAFLMDRNPVMTPKAQKLSMIRHFELDDDTKEYWGFYLLKGSEVSVSSCARHLGANVMLIKGVNNLKFCAYVGQESTEDISSEIDGLETHKLLEQFEMATNKGDENAAPPMFRQPNKKEDQSRIIQLLKYRNEKRKIIKMLEKENINSETNSTVSSTILAQVEDALKKILHQEINSLYREVKSIIFSGNSTRQLTVSERRNGTKRTEKKHWFAKPFDVKDTQLSAIMDDDEVDEDEDGAFEMDDDYQLVNNTMTDGIADDRGTIDHNHVNDTSQSNEESSFSSSEEAMLNCRGVLLSQPLVPESQCSNTSDPSHNAVRYKVTENGYYYFIFSSANEKVKNKLTVKFELQKTVYNVTGATDICVNSTTCHFPLNFVSNQRVVLSVPSPDNRYSPVWDETFLAQSVCEPRTPLYVAFVMILPLSILFCALH